MSVYEYEGKQVTPKDLAKITGKSIHWVYTSLGKYKTIEELVEAGKNKKMNTVYTYNGVKGTLRKLMKYSKVNYHTLAHRLYQGWDIKRALEEETRRW